MEMLVRAATASDIKALVALLQESDAFHALAQPDVFRGPTPPIRDEAYVGRLLAEENGAILVAECSNSVAALVQLAFYREHSAPTRSTRPYAVIGDLVVAREFRRTGIGRALMSAAHDWAQGRGASEIQLGVWNFNEGAVALYESLGYRTVHSTMSKSIGQTRA